MSLNEFWINNNLFIHFCMRSVVILAIKRKTNPLVILRHRVLAVNVVSVWYTVFTCLVIIIILLISVGVTYAPSAVVRSSFPYYVANPLRYCLSDIHGSASSLFRMSPGRFVLREPRLKTRLSRKRLRRR